jgi:hypothetical protein
MKITECFKYYLSLTSDSVVRLSQDRKRAFHLELISPDFTVTFIAMKWPLKNTCNP